MKLVLVLLICVTLALRTLVAQWANRYGKPLNFQCRSHQSIGSIQSSYDTDYKDRAWNFSCRNTFRKSGSCSWSGYVNNFKQRINYACPHGSVLSGMSSYQDNGKEDRRWRFLCCSGKVQRRNCQWSNYVNDFEQQLTWRAAAGQFLFGISSYYDNEHKDRSWAFGTCEK